MNLRQLELFLRVAKTKSFQKCAQEAFTTQSTVSQHIASLEEDLGVQLLERSRGGVWLTEAGKIVFAHASRILGEVRATEEEMRRFKGMKETTLRIAASTVPSTYLLPSALSRLFELFPGIAIDVKQRSSRQVVELIRDHEADVGVVGNRFGEKGIYYERIGAEVIRLVVPPAHPWASRGSILPGELAGEPIVARTAGSGTEKTVVEALRAVGVEMPGHAVRLRVETSEAVKSAVMAGIGVSFLSGLAVKRELERGDLAAVAVEGLNIERDFYLIRRSTLNPPPAAALFCELIVKSLPNKGT